MSTIRFGISHLPPETGNDAEFLDSLVEQGHRGLELPFTQGFPWKERRCRSFGELAAERDVRLSVHAPYFAGLTIQDEDKGKRSLASRLGISKARLYQVLEEEGVTTSRCTAPPPTSPAKARPIRSP